MHTNLPFFPGWHLYKCIFRISIFPWEKDILETHIHQLKTAAVYPSFNCNGKTNDNASFLVVFVVGIFVLFCFIYTVSHIFVWYIE